MTHYPPRDPSDTPHNPDTNPHPGPGDFLPDGLLPTFVLGQRVVHRDEGYRGVVVDFDMACQSDEQWARDIPSQPAMEQPWYHVLIHDSTANTYVAQENLATDNSAHPVDHPLIAEFFDDYRNGRYVRNDALWPTW